MRKILITALALILILSICVFPAAAAGNGSLGMTGASGKQGDTVTVSVNLNSNPGLITMKFAVSYPGDLELLGVQNTGLLGGWTTPAPTISSPYTIRWADSLATTNNTATGKIVTLTFKIKDTATPGNKTVSLTFNESRDAEGGKNSFGNASATVTVNCKTHNYGNYTSTGDAQHSRTCSACGNVESANHSWNSGTVNKQPSCKEAGEKTYTCSVCNGTKKETLDKTNDHSYSSWSAVDGDTHKRTCSVCQNVESDGHDWDAGQTTLHPSCKTEGEKAYTCITCHQKKTESLPKTSDHSYGAWTEVNDSVHTHTCSVCDKEETATHTWNSGVITQNATCKEAGTKTFTCTACNTTKAEVIAILTTHTYDHACDPDCNICGQTRSITHSYKSAWSKDQTTHWLECAVCKDKKDEAEHTPGAKATETTAQTCTTCGYILKAALGHKHSYATTWTTDEKGHWYACSDCEEKGSYEEHNFENACDPDCSVCGYTRQTQHTYGDQWISDKDEHWHVCSSCDEKSDAAAHEPGAEATQTTAQTCTICSYEIVPALGGEPTEPTAEPDPEPTEPTGSNPPDNQGTPLKTGFPWWIILAAVVAAGVVIAIVVIKKKKN